MNGRFYALNPIGNGDANFGIWNEQKGDKNEDGHCTDNNEAQKQEIGNETGQQEWIASILEWYINDNWRNWLYLWIELALESFVEILVENASKSILHLGQSALIGNDYQFECKLKNITRIMRDGMIHKAYC